MHRLLPGLLASLFVFAAGLLLGIHEVRTLPGVPEHARYHASDMDELRLMLLGYSVRPEYWSAGPDHPAWYAICGVYQKVSAGLGLSGMRLWNITLPILVGLNLVMFRGLARRLGFTPLQSVGLTMVLLATGATVTWSVVLETHVLAPTTLLLVALVLTDRRLAPRIWNRPGPVGIGILGAAIATAASITITNAALALALVVPAAHLRRLRPGRVVRETVRRLPTLVAAGFVGIGLLALVHLAGWYLIQDPAMRQFLDVLAERRHIPYMEGSWWESVLSLSWIAPPMDEYLGIPGEGYHRLRRTWETWIAYGSGALVLLGVVLSLRVCTLRTMFIPAFAIFGVLLHSIFGLGESFLFSANYAWASVLSIGLLVRSVAPRWLGGSCLVLAAILLVVNLGIWHAGIDWIVRNDYVLPVLP